MFEVEQTYDVAALTALCRAARKTTRPVWRVIRGAVWVTFAVGTLLLAAQLALQSFGKGDLRLLLSVAVLLLFLLFEDKLNAWVALRQMVPGTAHSTTVFGEDAYTVTTDTTQTRWQYENITALAETRRYYFCFLGKRHGQCFDKQGFRQGDSEAFRTFIEQKTGKSINTIK
ncbi:MAG: YcxB family protein [Ruminococcaceae bacterium]|nr:YcxB family protein [Oscillospiraceae bacterium]